MKTQDIAPCGLNCSLCYAYQRKKNKCPGCNGTENKPTYCKTCQIRFCDKKKEVEFCGLCEAFPCKRLKSLQKRYNEKYGVNLYQNLSTINLRGIETFLMEEEMKWKCKKCRNIISMHTATCATCGEINPYYTGKRT